MKSLNSLFRKKLSGMMATSHVIVSLCLLCVVLMLPLPFFDNLYKSLISNPFSLIVNIVIFIGFSLLVDLDNGVSTAGSELGLIGNLTTVFMQSSSGVVFNVLRLKGDRTPISQHRYLWHTPFIVGVLYYVFTFGIPDTSDNLFTSFSNMLKNDNIIEVLSKQVSVFIFFYMAFLATVVGSALVIKFLKKFIKIQWWYKYVLSTLVLIYLVFTEYQLLKVTSTIACLGYLFHILEDAVCDSGIPLLFPIPIGNRFWRRIKLSPVTITTGGTSNKIVEVIAIVLLPFLVYYLSVIK